MNDEQVLTAMRRSLIAETDDLGGMDVGRPAEAVMARGRTLRVRRRLAKGLTSVAAAGVALGLALTLPFGGTGTRPVHVNLAAWSVNTNPGGTVTFKLKKLSDPAGLQHVLGEAGVPAIVRWKENCREQRRIVGAPAARIVSEKYVGGPHGRFERADGQLLPGLRLHHHPLGHAQGCQVRDQRRATASQRTTQPPIRRPMDRLGACPGRSKCDLRPGGATGGGLAGPGMTR